MTQGELAVASGVAPKTLYNVFNGGTPNRNTLAKLQRALGLSTDIEVAELVIEGGDRIPYYTDDETLAGPAMGRALVVLARRKIDQNPEVLDSVLGFLVGRLDSAGREAFADWMWGGRRVVVAVESAPGIDALSERFDLTEVEDEELVPPSEAPDQRPSRARDRKGPGR